MIPKIIHQTWKNNDLPKHWKQTPETWKKYHPDWEYKLWTDEDNRKLISTKYPWFLKIYDSYPHGIQRADAVRYFILYTYGGLYVDLDIQCVKNIEPLIHEYMKPETEVLIVPTKNNLTSYIYYTNAIMMSKPRSNFWKHIWRRLIRHRNNEWWQIGKHFQVMYSTGPMMFTYAYYDFPNKKKIGIIPSDYLHPCTVCDPKPSQKLGSYVRIIDGSSWVMFDHTMYTYLYCKSDIFIIIIFIILFILIKIYFRNTR